MLKLLQIVPEQIPLLQAPWKAINTICTHLQRENYTTAQKQTCFLSETVKSLAILPWCFPLEASNVLRKVNFQTENAAVKSMSEWQNVPFPQNEQYLGLNKFSSIMNFAKTVQWKCTSNKEKLNWTLIITPTLQLLCDLCITLRHCTHLQSLKCNSAPNIHGAVQDCKYWPYGSYHGCTTEY